MRTGKLRCERAHFLIALIQEWHCVSMMVWSRMKRKKLLEELEFKIKQEREKLEKRKEVAFKRDKLRLIQVLIEPNH